MFAATLVLFLLPTWVLWTASGRLTSEKAKGTPPNWQTYFGWAQGKKAALQKRN
jgi:hypothetical protein